MKFLQQNELVGNTPVAIATFLRDENFLDKRKIGDYLGGQYVGAASARVHNRNPKEGGDATG